MSTSPPIVEMTGISISFPGVKALDGVDLRLFPGEVHTLMGENGAGKSTMIKALTGVYSIDEGEIRVDGEVRRFGGTADAQAAGVSTVYQEVNLCTNLTIGENVMLGQEVRGPLGINWRATHREAQKALERLGMGHLNPRQQLSTLPLALQQLVAISRSVVAECRVLILDEPTSSLDAAEVEQLFTVMRRLRDEGVAILFVSHFLDQVYEISDRLTVLRNGRFVAEHATAEIERSKLISEMIGKEAATLSAIEATARPDLSENDVVYAAEGIGRKGMLDAMDLEVRAGEVIGLAGLLGSGRTELARLIYGADRPDSGRVSIRGKKIDISRPAAALAHGIALSSENRRDEGIIRDLTVRENIILAVQAKRGWARPVPRREQDEIVRRYIDALGVRPPHPERPIKNLSGGNQQKVLLGRWLATHPDLLILDEPTRGIDVGAKAEIQEHVAKLADEGVSVIFISSELDEVVRLSDRIIVMKDHRKIAELDGGVGVSAESIVEAIAADHNEEEVSS
ncbi:MAG: sugar ABC transporter ATP-binding protein [Microbacterium gubbeenense]|uniref:sugar ABC transporter ATP-binding protein n=2 Tax=Microbacterium gubbeenense TaxID=159896 RepID=UPI00041FBAFF|nr:sugar ABC transporter ATP-binding protein [Microbacterium gubbeenense]